MYKSLSENQECRYRSLRFAKGQVGQLAAVKKRYIFAGKICYGLYVLKTWVEWKILG